MAEKSGRSADEFLPVERTLTSLRGAAAGCRGCDLWAHGTRTVFGEGSSPGFRRCSAGDEPRV